MLSRLSGNIRYILIAVFLFSLLLYFAYVQPQCAPCFPSTQSSGLEEREPNKKDCPQLVACEEAPPCVCPDCKKKEEDDSEPCPEVTAPPVIVHPCPVPEPCPEQDAPTIESERHRWDGNSITVPLGAAPWKETCLWKTVNWSGEIRFDMCVRQYSDIVSDAIKGSGGRWGDCDILVSMWQQTARAAEAVRKHDPEGLFVDAGANIGACTLLMAAVGHKTLGFEPLRANLFYLTSGILGNQPVIREKITIYQLGLGTHSINISAYAASGNAGNTQLGSMVKDWPAQTWREESNIPVMSLDDILWPDPTTPPPHIRLMKMDVQGYEVKILKGAKRLLEAGAIGIIKSELTNMFLQGQGTTAMEMVNLIMGHGYILTGEYDEKPLNVNQNFRDQEVVFRYKEKEQ